MNNLDNEYKSILAKSLYCPVKNLASITGPTEFQDLLRKYRSENFHVGDFLSENFNERYCNVLNKIFRINLHMHTTASDGMLYVEELLDQAAAYAESVKNIVNDDLPPFVIAITDHDSIEGSKKALTLISKDPEKYRNIKFVAGIEFSVKLVNEKILKSPISTDLMGYCINPFDESFNRFLNNAKQLRYNEAKKLLSEINKLGIDVNWEDIQNSHILIKNAASMAFFEFILRYICKNYKKSPEFIKYKEKIENLFKGKQAEFSPSVKEVAEALEQSFGYIGLAHPGRIHLSKLEQSKISPEKFDNYRAEGLYLLLKDAVNQGALVSEANYHYTLRHYSQELQQSADVANCVCDEENILKTGGTDGHRANIFSHIEDFTDEQLKSLLRG